MMEASSSSHTRKLSWGTIMLCLTLVAVLNLKEDGFMQNLMAAKGGSIIHKNNNKVSTTDEDQNDDDGDKNGYRFIAYDRQGHPLPLKYLPESVQAEVPKISSSSWYQHQQSAQAHQLSLILKELAQQDISNPNATAVIALRIVGGDEESYDDNLAHLATIVDEFLTPRLDWRLVAERFESPLDTELFHDPIIHASPEHDGSGNFGTAAASAWRNLLNEARANVKGSESMNEDELLKAYGINFMLIRVMDEKLSAFANALRRYQFPETEEECQLLDQQSLGRTFIQYGGTKDFLGASTQTAANAFALAIGVGARFIEATPAWWGHVYQFDNCTAANGVECAFLPNYGGTCLRPRVQPSMECLGKFHMGSLQAFALPKEGVPQEVCDQARRQMPVPDLNDTSINAMNVVNQNRGPPPAFLSWCPDCGFGGGKEKPSPHQVASTTEPISINAFKSFGSSGIENYVNGRPVGENDFCSLETSPIKCGNEHNCCINELQIPKSSLSGVPREEPMIQSALSSFLTRFNRESRRRIARLHIPRMKAINARNQGWEEALATGSCATLHIRRGDNINRCEKGETHFCSMNRTLEDYMNKAIPMLEHLDNSKHVFVMTDDAEEVTDAKLRPWQEKGYLLEVVSGHNQYSDLTYSDWDPFLESLYTAQSCRAVVGHHISTVSRLVYRSMCTRWGECPLEDMNP